MSFYANFLEQCAKKNVTVSAAAKAIGLSNAAASGWKKGKNPSNFTLFKLANFFECNISELTDNSSLEEDSVSQDFFEHEISPSNSVFFDNFLRLCNNFNCVPTKVASEIGLTGSVVYRWGKGALPHKSTLIKLADYFGCSISELTGEVEQKEKPAPESGPNKDMLLAWIENAGRDELIEALQAVTKKLSEK